MHCLDNSVIVHIDQVQPGEESARGAVCLEKATQAYLRSLLSPKEPYFVVCMDYSIVYIGGQEYLMCSVVPMVCLHRHVPCPCE